MDNCMRDSNAASFLNSEETKAANTSIAVCKIERALDDVQDAIEDRLLALQKSGLISAEDTGAVASWFLRSRVWTLETLEFELNASDSHDWRNGLDHYAACYKER